jgi:hypothetical protein
MMLWPEEKGWKDTLTQEEAFGRAGGLNQLIKDTKVESDKLGDDIDFITIVGDMPYRYQTSDGVNCLDDLLGRIPQGQLAPRWAYVGRITGSLEYQIYQVMCGLFLQPRDAKLFNGYDPGDSNFKDYFQSAAASRLLQFGIKNEQIGMGSLGNWQKAFFPRNQSGLLIINTSGDPTSFNLRGGSGTTWDVPWTSPTRIHIIHSFSAANAQDPYTIAGRWLANGAYAYFGSVHEPFLQSFRTPGLIADALAEGYPWGAAVRQNTPRETFGHPWRLIVFGDPMMTIVRPGDMPARVSLERIDSWPTFAFEPLPTEDSAAIARFAWSLRQFLIWGSGADSSHTPKSIVAVLEKIGRSELPESMRRTRDELLACLAIESRRHDLAFRLVKEVPSSERTDKLTRLIETICYERLQNSLAHSALEDAVPAWRAIVQVCKSEHLRISLTAPVRKAINSPVRRRLWIRALESLKKDKEIDPKFAKWLDELLIEAENMHFQGTG